MDILSDLYNNLYHNFFSVCSLIPVAFNGIMAMIFFKVKNKSKSTIIYAIVLTGMSIFFLGYFISAFVYHPLAAYHRLITMASVYASEIAFILFFFYFPNERNTFFAKIFGIILIIIAALLYTTFILGHILKQKIIYNFENHTYDFAVGQIDQLLAMSVLLLLFIFLFTGLWRFFVTKDKERWAVLSFAIVIFIGIFIPAVSNVLSKSGIVTRGFFQVSQDLSNLTAYFFASIIFINATTDRTSFMTKIIAITFATFLIVFQGVSYFGLKDQEKAFDLIKIKDTSLAIYNNYRPDELSYLLSYSIDTSEFSYLYKKSGDVDGIDKNSIRAIMINSAIFEKYRSLTGSVSYEETESIFKIGNKFTSGYKDAMLGIYSGSGKVLSKNDVTDAIKKLDAYSLYCYKKVDSYPDGKVRYNAVKFFTRYNKPLFNPMKKVILDHIAASNADDNTLRSELLSFLAPMKPAGTHFFKEGYNYKGYISYIEINFKDRTIYEAGYDYVHYRRFLHPSASILIFILAGIITMILIGFKYFFLGAIIKPLNKLQKGIDDVQNGNLNVIIPISVEDEIGFITRNFNTMVENTRDYIVKIVDSEKQIKEYNEHLEEMVEERTKKLVESEKMAALGNLVASVAHEINTPVGTSITAATHLKKFTNDFVMNYESGKITRADFKIFTDTCIDTSDLIYSALNKAGNLITSFKRLAVDQTDEVRRIFNVQEYFSEILRSLQPNIKEKAINFNFHCDINLKINNYPGLFFQIISNLVTNSIIHGFENSNNGTIKIDVIEENSEVLLLYSDNGKGIPQNIIEHMYDPFFTTKRNLGCTGLGMNIVYNIVVKRLGGTISLHSTVLNGFSLKIVFPK